MTLERSLEESCRKEVERTGGMLIKLLPYCMNGLPDRLCILPDRPVFFIELKRPGKKLRPLQEAIHRKLLKLGQSVYTVDNLEQLKVILLHHLSLPTYDFRATSKS